MWLAPLFLLGLLGLAAPLWLHRFARQTDQKQPFASLMFLEASQIRRSRRHELRYWLLLLLRWLLLALLVFAFAGPLWRVAVKPGTTAATLHVIAVDTSLSMNYMGVWDRTQQRVGDLLNSVRGADRAMLVAADHRLRVMHEPVFAGQVAAIRAALQGMRPGQSRLDYGALLSGSAAWGAGPGETVVLHVVSDMQQSASPLRFADLQAPPGVNLDLIDVGEAKSVNLRVADVALDERDTGRVMLRLEGDFAATAGRQLVLQINGVERGRKPLPRDITLPATEYWDIGDLGDGEHRLSVRLEPADALPQDDAYFALVRRVRPKVMLVAAATNGDDAIYLRAAMQSLENPQFDVDTVQPSALPTRSLSEFAAIVVADAGLLNAAAAEALRKYVSDGGAALLALGARAAQQPAVPVSGAAMARGRAGDAGNKPARVAELEQSHPLLREASAWRSIRFFRHVAVTAPIDSVVLMRFEDGAPLFFEQSLQGGKLLTFASPLDRDWNDLAIHPLFVRFVAESVAYLAGARAAAATATIGAPLEADLARRGGGQVFDPAGKRAVLLDGKTDGPRLVPELAGYYEVRGGGRSDFIAVNPDARESALAALDTASRERWLALKAVPLAAAEAQQSAVAAADPAMRNIPIWFWLLFGAALLAFVEPIVANYHLHVLREGRS
jgi:hypothetical protein